MEQTAALRPGFFAQAVRRRWWLLLAGVLLGLVAGYGALTQLPVTYASTATLYLNPLVGNPYAPDLAANRTDQLTALQTEAALVEAAPVVDLAIRASATPLPEPPEDHLEVVTPSNTQVLELSFEAPTAAAATAGAQAFADAYLQYRSARAAQANAELATQVQAQLAAVGAVIAEVSGQLADAPDGSAAELQLEEQLSVYAAQRAQLDLALSDATVVVSSPGQVVSPADPAVESGLPPWVVLTGALLAGLALGLLAALAREHSDERLRDPDELTVLGVGHPLAELTAGSGEFDPDRPAPAEYRRLHSAVTARAGTSPVTCIVGSAPATADVAAGLAATAYRLGHDALVVGIDQPGSWRTAARALPASRIRAASGRIRAPREAANPHLVVVPPERNADATEEFLLSPALPTFVTGARTSATVVTLAGGSAGTASGQTLASMSDVTLVVVELGIDTFTGIADAVEQLQEAGVAQVCLVVLTGGRRRSRRRRSAPPSPTARAVRYRLDEPATDEHWVVETAGPAGSSAHATPGDATGAVAAGTAAPRAPGHSRG